MALSLGQSHRAQDFLQKAAEEYPNNSEPWLRLCDLALAGNDVVAARRYLDEAEKRGATGADLSVRSEKLRAAEEAQPETPVVVR